MHQLRHLVPGIALCVMPACISLDPPPVAALPPGGTHVLFIGNSLTYTHDLPDIVARLGALTGDTIRVAMLAKPNYALVDHLADGGARLALRSQSWDVVVLQQGSSALPESRVLLYAGVDSLLPLIRAAGGSPALYEVWPSVDRAFDVPAVRESYRTAALRAGGDFYPAGTAWQEAWARDSTLVLYSSDGLHPTATGSFLAALVMYERLTGKDARALPTVAYADNGPLALSAPTVRLLQEAAHAANARGMAP
jgi:hypothetical protein